MSGARLRFLSPRISLRQEGRVLKSVLIANRGEIACRIIRSAQGLGIRTIAVFSDADANSQHTRLADRAVRLGPPAPGQSYLDGRRIVELALEEHADCVHPGYGFLAESAHFAETVTAAGMTFVGPTADAIRAMGSKDRAKDLMAAAGVPVVPGVVESEQDDVALLDAACTLGFPVLIKPVAGGGGRGMRIVSEVGGLQAALSSARAEALVSFGDDTLMVEKLVVNARHVEVQVLADNYGKIIHLLDRDCSMQRRHQKLIEEAPAVSLHEELRSRMFRSALRAARAVNYRGAGTIEFLVGPAATGAGQEFWFIEMNTRLQVEHPVTEQVTGIDIVDWQFRIASGERLAMRQGDISARGHAIEARLCAERVEEGFLPATGQLSAASFPDFLRVESGVSQWDRITPYYDSMIAKLIASGNTRIDALRRLRRALRETRLSGIDTNQGFLNLVVASCAMEQGGAKTEFLSRELAVRSPGECPPVTVWFMAALTYLGEVAIASSFSGFALWGYRWQQLRIGRGAEERLLDVHITAHSCEVRWEDDSCVSRIGSCRVRVNGSIYDYAGCVCEGSVWILHGGVWMFRVIQPETSQHTAATSRDTVRSPMPGFVRTILVGAGETVVAGDTIAVLEAMKMEHELVAGCVGVVARLRVEVGQQVEADAIIAELEEREAGGEDKAVPAL